MLTSVFDLFKLGVGPSSSHTNGPMVAAKLFLAELSELSLNVIDETSPMSLHLTCQLTGSLAHTGVGHGTDIAIILGFNGYDPEGAAALCSSPRYEELISALKECKFIDVDGNFRVNFNPETDIIYDKEYVFSQHPNGIVFTLQERIKGEDIRCVYSNTYFSIGGGFVTCMQSRCKRSTANGSDANVYPFLFDSAKRLLNICDEHQLSFAMVQRSNELVVNSSRYVDNGLKAISRAMFLCIEKGLAVSGVLPGGLGVKRRAKSLLEKVQLSKHSSVNDFLCAYAIAVNEENAAGQAVVTAPTNGAAGVIPSVLYYLHKHMGFNQTKINEFLLTAAVIGSLIKYRSSISGAEVGCQGEIGAASAMAAAGCCAVFGGSPEQVENAAEIALEHHLGMTCDPVMGLVQIPCIERNGFGAIKAFSAASLALHGEGEHLISLDSCIAAMKQTGEEMSVQFKETSLGGLAVKWVDC